MTKRSQDNQDIYALICGMIVLCVLLTLLLRAADTTVELSSRSEKGAAAVRFLPVYSYLGTSETDESFLMDTTHGGEGYFAVTAKSERQIKVKLVSPNGTESVYNVPNNGLVAYYPLSAGNGTYSIQILRKIEDDTHENLYERVLSGSCEALLFDEFQPFLRPSTYVWFTGYSSCVNSAARLCSGESSDDSKIELIKSFICETMNYDESLAAREDQGFIRDPDAILARGSGTCLDYAVLAAAMLRSQGIPAKVVYGHVNGMTDELHAWNMVYSSSRGWFRIDLAFADDGALEGYISDDANYEDTGWY